MKNTLICYALLCGSAAAAPYYLPSPQPGQLTPYDWQPTWRVDGLYAIGGSDTPDTWGFRTGFDLYSNGEARIRHQFSVHAAPQWGDGHRHRYEDRTEQDLFHLPLTAGYTLNLGFTDEFFLFLGGKAGWAFGHYKEKGRLYHESKSYNGFTFTVGGGLKYQCSERLYVQLGYDFGRTYTNTHHDDTLTQHIIYAGLEWRY